MRRTREVISNLLEEKYVLVVEPALNYKNSIRSFLTNLKISKVKFVNSAQEAKRELLTTKVGLFIVEWGLPGENGIQFCRGIRHEKAHESTPFLLLTVENLKEDVVLASEVGIDGYLLKPFSYEDFTEAIKNICLARSKPNQVNLLINKGLEHLGNQELEAAFDAFKAAEEANPNSARAIGGLARIAALRDQPAEAIELYNKSIRLNPEYVDAYRGLVELHLVHGPVDRLISLAESVNNLSPGNPKYTLILAKAYLEKRNLRKSDKYFKMSIRLSPKLAEAYKGLGKINMIQEDYKSAMKNFGKALDLDKTDVSILNSLGLSYVKLEQFEQGIEKYRAALKIRPHDARILFNLGYAKEKIGDIEQAIFYYQQSLSHHPGFDKPTRRLQLLSQKKPS